MNLFDVVLQGFIPLTEGWIDFGGFDWNRSVENGPKSEHVCSILIIFLSCVKYLKLIKIQNCIQYPNVFLLVPSVRFFTHAVVSNCTL